jgi:L,D-peptidoglycan transpeptidase YkuD (ErfK/YbiS/YcfS/YnhG family)
MPYLTLTATTECVDDSHSRFYNRIVDRSKVTPDWSSSEHMLAVGKYYQWGVVVDQNSATLPQGGSCVFLHIWGGDGTGTEGCTAMARHNLKVILAWLRPQAHPLLVQMPLKTYRQVEKELRLPIERCVRTPDAPQAVPTGNL